MVMYIISMLILLIPAIGSLCGCDFGNTDERIRQAKLNSEDQVSALQLSLEESIPENYLSGVDEVSTVISSTDTELTAELIERQTYSIKLDILKVVARNILTEEKLLCADRTNENDLSKIETACNALSKEIDAAGSFEEIYELAATLEERLYSSVCADFSAENESGFVVTPAFCKDNEQNTWLIIHTNFLLPGFEDSKYGYLLRLDLDGGKSELSVADSIYNHGSIKYDGACSVRFNLSDILKNCTPEDFLSGRNRVTFSMFALDDSYTFSKEFYKLRLSDYSTDKLSEVRIAFSNLIYELI